MAARSRRRTATPWRWGACGRGQADKTFDGRAASATIADGQPAPHDDILINVELFRGAIRRGNWKLMNLARLPGKTEMFDVDADPGETTNLADKHPEVVHDLEARLVAYARPAINRADCGKKPLDTRPRPRYL